MTTDTKYTLDQFLADTRATIRTKGIPAGLAERSVTTSRSYFTTRKSSVRSSFDDLLRRLED